MNEQVWWYAARSSGLVAWVLVTLAIVWGLSLSTRITRGKPTPAWLLDLHRWLGALSLIFTAIHIAGLVADSYVYFGWSEILIPGASEWQPLEVAWGIVAMYFMVAIQLTSLFMRKIPRKVWRWVHMTSWLVFGLATWHGLTAGTDVENVFFRWVAIGSVQVVAFLTFVRVMAGRKARGRSAQPRPSLAT